MEQIAFASSPLLKLSAFVVAWLLMIHIFYAILLRIRRIDIYLKVRAFFQFSDVIMAILFLGYLVLTSAIEEPALTISVASALAMARIWHAIELSKAGFSWDKRRG